MTVAEATKTSATPFVGMGQLLTAQPPVRLASVLGSCVAVCLYHPRLRVAGMAHVVLPESTGHQGGPGKFADTAVPALLAALEKLTGLKAGYRPQVRGQRTAPDRHCQCGGRQGGARQSACSRCVRALGRQPGAPRRVRSGHRRIKH